MFFSFLELSFFMLKIVINYPAFKVAFIVINIIVRFILRINFKIDEAIN